MKHIPGLLSLIGVIIILLPVHAQIPPAIEWQKSLGGSANDYGYSIQQTVDGGYVAVGVTSSNDGDVSGNHGPGDFWVVKLEGNGDLAWQKCLGGTGPDGGYSIQQTTDSGFIVAGSTMSNDGDVSGDHTVIYAPTTDYWIVKLDASGNLIWQKCLGGYSDETAQSIGQTSDGGYIVAGYSNSNDGDVSGNHGQFDYWVVKTDAAGNKEWQKSFGGSSNDYGNSIEQTDDGGYIVAGWTESNDGDVSGFHGGVDDYWIVRLDTSGGIMWQKTLGGNGNDAAYSVQETNDGGFIVGGVSDSNDGNVSGNNGTGDFWVVKLDVNGNITWQKSLGGSAGDVANSIRQTFDGSFIVAGYSESDDSDVSGNHGEYDYWIVKLGIEGNILWQKSMGGSSHDEAFSIQQTTDSGYIVAGRSWSNDSDVTGNHGNADYWVVKLAPDIATGIAPVFANFVSIYPNPATSQIEIITQNENQKQQLKISNALGQVQQQPVFYSAKILVDISALPAGIYFLDVQNERQKVVKKFVKE